MSSPPIDFKLFAPNNKQVELLIAHTQDRQSRQQIPMVKDDQTGYFHCQVSNLQDGDYEYRFRLQTCSPNYKPDEWLDVIDPCVTQYDAINNEGLVTVKQGRKLLSSSDDYEWKYDHVKLPENKDLIIYELYVADFTAEGTLKAILDSGKLDYLSQELGINAVELLPIQGMTAIGLKNLTTIFFGFRIKISNKKLFENSIFFISFIRIDGYGTRLGLLDTALLCFETFIRITWRSEAVC
jgi:1,4-alpha-glucan branching enzyme